MLFLASAALIDMLLTCLEQLCRCKGERNIRGNLEMKTWRFKFFLLPESRFLSFMLGCWVGWEFGLVSPPSGIDTQVVQYSVWAYLEARLKSHRSWWSENSTLLLPWGTEGPKSHEQFRDISGKGGENRLVCPGWIQRFHCYLYCPQATTVSSAFCLLF